MPGLVCALTNTSTAYLLIFSVCRSLFILIIPTSALSGGTMFAFLDRCFNTLSHVPRVLRNKVHSQLLSWFPDLMPPVCHPGDFLCRETNGLFKFEDIFHKKIIDGLDWCSENPYLVASIAGTALVGGGIFYCFRKCQTTAKANTPTTAKQSLGLKH